MADPSVIIDLSVVVRLNKDIDWRNVERVVKAWKEQRDSRAVFYGVADNSLWHNMDDYGRRGLGEWKKRRWACSVSFADPEILDLAEANPGATVITNDLYRDHRADYPWLQGTTRMVRPVIDGSSVTFEQLDFSPIPDHEISLRREDVDLKLRGITSPEAVGALAYEWACTNPDCGWGMASLIDDDPVYEDGRVCCPECLTPARRAGTRESTRLIVVLLGDDVADRIPIVEGTSIVVGRGRGDGRFDVRPLLDDGHSRLVSRDHVRITNKTGRLHVEELGSRNGTVLIGEDGDESRLEPGVLQILRLEERISIARGALQIRPSGRKRARGRYAPDHTTAPWQT